MAAGWIEHITGSFDDKRRWRQYKARKLELPANYRIAIDGLERYFCYAGAIAKGDVFMRMLEDLADLIEQGAADLTPIRDIVGDDPVEFAEVFIKNYSDGQWINKERQRLTDTIAEAVSDGARRTENGERKT